MAKQNLIINFSGGLTSAYMTWLMWNQYQDVYNMQVVFANTGHEHEETYKFIARFSTEFNIPITWIEAVVHLGLRKAPTHKIVNYSTAYMSHRTMLVDGPFHSVIEKYGIPNVRAAHCTNMLKVYPIQSYAKSIFGKDNYYTAIGIRNDEIDRMNSNRKKLKLIYPLIEYYKININDVRSFWRRQNFTLNIIPELGNCVFCFKKSFKKIKTAHAAAPQYFDFTKHCEFLFNIRNAQKGKKPVYFFRGNKSTNKFLAQKKANEPDNIDFDGGSCEVYTECK